MLSTAQHLALWPTQQSVSTTVCLDTVDYPTSGPLTHSTVCKHHSRSGRRPLPNIWPFDPLNILWPPQSVWTLATAQHLALWPTQQSVSTTVCLDAVHCPTSGPLTHSTFCKHHSRSGRCPLLNIIPRPGHYTDCSKCIKKYERFSEVGGKWRKLADRSVNVTSCNTATVIKQWVTISSPKIKKKIRTWKPELREFKLYHILKQNIMKIPSSFRRRSL